MGKARRSEKRERREQLHGLPPRFDRASRCPTRKKSRRRPPSATHRLAQSSHGQRVVAGLMYFVFEWSRIVGRDRASRVASRFARTIGPLAGEHQLARANLAAAFPDRSQAELERILAGVWDSVARATIEYAFLEDIVTAFDPNRPGHGPIDVVGLEHAYALRDSGKAGIIFGAHIANWELTAAVGTKLGLPVIALYRPPSNPFIDREMSRRRSTFVRGLVVSGRGAALQVAAELRRGNHIGIIADQRINDGQIIDFFGRPSLSNPVIGHLARLFDCPVHGVRTVRLPEGRFRLEMTPALALPRDARGRVDPVAANVMIHGVVEEWIREHPEQWLWLHDRWKVAKALKKRKKSEKKARKRARRAARKLAKGKVPAGAAPGRHAPGQPAARWAGAGSM